MRRLATAAAVPFFLLMVICRLTFSECAPPISESGESWITLQPLLHEVVPRDLDARANETFSPDCLKWEVMDYAVFCMPATRNVPLPEDFKNSGANYRVRPIKCDNYKHNALWQFCAQYFTPFPNTARPGPPNWPFSEGLSVREVDTRARLATRRTLGSLLRHGKAHGALQAKPSRVGFSSQLELESTSRQRTVSTANSHAPFLARDLWATRTISYCFSARNFYVSVGLVRHFWQACQEMSLQTPLRFRYVNCDAPGHKIAIGRVSGFANSYVGALYPHIPSASSVIEQGIAQPTEATSQDINFDPAVFNTGSALHELMHAVGFHHIHLSSNRDRFVQLNNPIANADADTLQWCKRNVFVKSGDPVDQRVPYDYGSILHYSQDVGKKCSSLGGNMFLQPKPDAKLKAEDYSGAFDNLGSTGFLTEADKNSLTTAYQGKLLV